MNQYVRCCFLPHNTLFDIIKLLNTKILEIQFVLVILLETAAKTLLFTKDTTNQQAAIRSSLLLDRFVQCVNKQQTETSPFLLSTTSKKEAKQQNPFTYKVPSTLTGTFSVGRAIVCACFSSFVAPHHSSVPKKKPRETHTISLTVRQQLSLANMSTNALLHGVLVVTQSSAAGGVVGRDRDHALPSLSTQRQSFDEAARTTG